MVTIRKRHSKWHFQTRRSRQSKTRTFTHKADAHRWATRVEREIDTDEFNSGADKLGKSSVKDLVHRYREEISTTKKSGCAASYRLNTLQKYFRVYLSLARVTSSHVAQYRDQRLGLVKSSNVRMTGRRTASFR